MTRPFLARALSAAACVAAAVGVCALPAAGQGAPPLGCGEGGRATAVKLLRPAGVSITRDGGMLIADHALNIVCRVAPGGAITRYAGIGLPGRTGDGGPATAARLEYPLCAREELSGAVLIRTGFGPERLRVVSRNGRISSRTGPLPRCDVATLPNGDRLVADHDRYVVRRVGSDGASRVVAGTGRCGVAAGDGGPATAATLAWPTSVAALRNGGFLVADERNGVVRRVSPGGTITTVAGRPPPPGTPDGAVCIQAEGSYSIPNYLVIRGVVRARAHRAVVVRYETTFDVAARFTITQGRWVVGSFLRSGTSGYTSARLPVSLAPGTYAIVLRARGSAPASSEDAARLPFTKTARARLVVR
jgi:hypothetical protein